MGKVTTKLKQVTYAKTPAAKKAGYNTLFRAIDLAQLSHPIFLSNAVFCFNKGGALRFRLMKENVLLMVFRRMLK